MRKPLITISAGLLICFTVKAQHIPDNNFAKAIRDACSECIDASNNLLPAAQDLKKLIVSNYNIASLEGLEGFSSLTVLDIHYNTLITSLPKLLVTLTELDISHTGINNLVSLPPKLDKFQCNYCQLTSLPALPASLSLLGCENTRLSSLPDLPESLTYLFANYSPISSLPKLPGKLFRLEIGGTNITTLPPLPDALKLLTIPGNNIGCYQSNNPGLEVWNADAQRLNTTFCPGYPKPIEVIAEKKPEQKVESTNKVTLQNSNGQDNGKCISGNCVNGIGVYVTKKGSTYKGSFKDGMMDGKGVLTSSDGTMYNGEWKKGVIEGAGTMVFKSGKKSTGIWKENKLWSGTGYFDYGEKGFYYGGVKENFPDGQGVYSFPNGKNFTGTFSKGNPVNGKGYIKLDKSSYEGTLVNGKFSGMGIYTNTYGQIFSGNFVDGDLNGNGKMIGTDGEQYDGNFKNTLPDGYGVLKLKDGRVYKGNWADGKQNGNGSSYDANGDLDYNGEWYEGKMQHPMESVSLGKEAEKSFSRITFKGYAYATVQDQDGKTFVWKVGITSEFHLRNNWLLYGTTEQEVVIDGSTYRRNVSFTGEFGVQSQTVYCSEEKTISSDPLPDGYFFMSGEKWHGILGDDRDHPGYHIIEGKNEQGNRFQIHDY